MKINKKVISLEGKYSEVFISPSRLEERTKECLVAEANSIIKAKSKTSIRLIGDLMIQNSIIKNRTLTIRDRERAIADTTHVLKSTEAENRKLIQDNLVLDYWYKAALSAFIITLAILGICILALTR